MDIGEIAVGVGGIIVALAGVGAAAWQAYLTHKERTASYRQTLYAKQVDGYYELMEIVNDLYIDVIEFTKAKAEGKVQDNFFADSSDKARMLLLKAVTWSYLLPNKDIANSIGQFVGFIQVLSAYFGVVLGKDEALKQKLVDESMLEQIETKFSQIYISLIGVGREALGVEPLNKETFGLLGQMVSKVKDQDIKKPKVTKSASSHPAKP